MTTCTFQGTNPATLKRLVFFHHRAWRGEPFNQPSSIPNKTSRFANLFVKIFPHPLLPPKKKMCVCVSARPGCVFRTLYHKEVVLFIWQDFIQQIDVPSLKLTWHLKMDGWKAYFQVLLLLVLGRVAICTVD